MVRPVPRYVNVELRYWDSYTLSAPRVSRLKNRFRPIAVPATIPTLVRARVQPPCDANELGPYELWYSEPVSAYAGERG